jgi:hypothetical protein
MSGGMIPPGGGGAPQLPPQVMQALMQRMQGGGGAPMPPPGGPPMGGPPQGMPPPGMPPGGPPHGMPPQQGSPFGGGGAPPQQGGPPPAAQLAAQGRFGDSIVAHVTPGEVSIPPQVQTPQLMAAIRAAFAHFGIDPAQFTAGSPQTSHNPNTGAPELSLWSALLPVAGAAAGSFIPGVGTAAGMAIGGALGGAAGGYIDTGRLDAAALGAAGGAAGGYVGGGGLGSLGGLAGSAGTAATEVPATAGTEAATATASGVGGNVFGPGNNPEIGAMSTAAQTGAAQVANPSPVTETPSILSRIPVRGSMLAGVGAGLGTSLAPTPTVNSAPPGFSNHMGPVNPNFNQMRGSGQVSRPNFAGYNPYAAVSGPNPGYNFYPQAT